jgi:hypothetical protein
MVELLVLTDDGQEVAGTFSLEKGRIAYKANKGYELLGKNIVMDHPVTDPQKWLDDLPNILTGTYLRARKG